MSLLFGSLLLILATSLYLAGMWFPAGVCCVLGGWWMSCLLDKVETEDES